MDAGVLGGRLPLLSLDCLGVDARRLYDRLVEGRLRLNTPFIKRLDTGELIGPFNGFLYAPGIAAGFAEFHEAEERETKLSARVREIVILSVGAVWASPYELYAHRAVAENAGLPAHVAAAVAAGEPCDDLSVNERVAQRFTLELTGERAVSDDVYTEAEQVFGRQGLVTLVFLAAAYGATCTMLNAFAVPAPSDRE